MLFYGFPIAVQILACYKYINTKNVCLFARIVTLAGTYGTCLHTGSHSLCSAGSGQGQGEYVPVICICVTGVSLNKTVVIFHGTTLKGRGLVRTGFFMTANTCNITADHISQTISLAL